MTIKRLIGSSPSQVSRNRDLGTMAFQNKESVQIGNIGAATDVVTLGNGQVTKDASGNVGIGTSSPSQKLHVYAASGSIRSLTETGNTSSAAFTAKNSGESADYGVDATGGFIQVLGAKPLLFYTNSTERMRLDSSGNLGLGVTPSAWTTFKSFEIPGGAVAGISGNQFDVVQNAYYDGAFKYKTTAAATLYQQAGAQHIWSNAPSGTAGNAITFTQAMTLDASGQLLVGISSYPTNADGIVLSPTLLTSSRSGTGANNHVSFRNGNGTVGIISTSGTTTTYATSSDYRLKENIQPMQNALDVVAQLNPVTYTWKADGSDGQGFIAHELQAVVPDCVTGEKDAVQLEKYEITPAIPAVLDEENNVIVPEVPAVMGEREVPVYQGIDTSFLVATLTKAIQEQQEQINQLKAEVASLKGA